MKKQKCCSICKKEFGIFRWRYECSECERTVCDDCKAYYPALDRDLCSDCVKKIDSKIINLTVVKSDHVRGHKITKSFSLIESTCWTRSPKDTIDNIKYQASKIGANAIVSLSVDRDTASEPGSGDGTHYYSVFKASGKPVIIEKKRFRGRDRKEKQKLNIGEELEKLAKLMEQGHLSKDEYEKAKKKLLNS